ncbi:MAG: hypothetical protein OCD01_10865 [Fibrobacterales bacterium]
MKKWDVKYVSSYPHKRDKGFWKKHTKEVGNVMLNFAKYIELLRTDEKPVDLLKYLSFVRNEGKGLYAIDPRPPAKAYPLRFYIYPKNGIVYVINFGDKDTQKKDVPAAHKVIEELKHE